MSFRLGSVPLATLLWMVRAVTPNSKAMSRQVKGARSFKPLSRSMSSKSGYVVGFELAGGLGVWGGRGSCNMNDVHMNQYPDSRAQLEY